ncbi:MAG: hypothetical protein Q8L81_16335 [Bacteroidota bacterium]|nr:hypothetical protein [Bacteroidota bacterium]
MENNEIVDPDKKTAKLMGIINGSLVVLMGLCCFSEDAAFFAFILGGLAGIVNFILMIVFIVQRKTFSYITCIISMLLMPIIGFGCCAYGIKGMGF